MRDHIGGGFHRYSVDAEWRVPHFEKMLYDQAQLALAYLEAAQVSGDRFYLDVAEDTLSYVTREMTDEAGGFYSAEDADSVPPEEAAQANGDHPRKSEGAFYLWRADEIDRRLGADADVFKLRFGIEPAGNAPSDPQQEFTGKNLLYAARTLDHVAQQTGKTLSDVAEALGRARLELFRARLDRPRPHRDDKVLTAWNGLMLAAFARAARLISALRGQEAGSGYQRTAETSAAFLRHRMWDETRQILLRRYRDGDAAIEGYAEDYAYLIFGLIELFQATADPQWLEWAIVLQRRQDALFWDDQDGGWFSTTGRDASVLLRMKDDYDGAEPTASSVSVLNLLTLTHLVEGADPEWNHRLERTLRLFGQRLEQMGRGVPMMSAALSTALAGVRQVVILGDPRAREPLERVVGGHYSPFSIVLGLDAEQQSRLSTRLPFIAAMRAPLSGAAAYACRDFTCLSPVTEPEALKGLLE
jgi:uncharacterized protein YyaL (SSP411 family)